MNHKTSFALLWIGLIVGLLIFFFGFMQNNRLIFWAGILVAVAGVAQTRVFYRCPHCGARLKTHGPLVKVCPDCGAEL